MLNVYVFLRLHMPTAKITKKEKYLEKILTSRSCNEGNSRIAEKELIRELSKQTDLLAERRTSRTSK